MRGIISVKATLKMIFKIRKISFSKNESWSMSLTTFAWFS